MGVFFTLFIPIYARILQFLHAWVEKYQNTSWLSCLHHKIYDYRKNQFFFFSEITTFITLRFAINNFFNHVKRLLQILLRESIGRKKPAKTSFRTCFYPCIKVTEGQLSNNHYLELLVHTIINYILDLISYVN